MKGNIDPDLFFQPNLPNVEMFYMDQNLPFAWPVKESIMTYRKLGLLPGYVSHRRNYWVLPRIDPILYVEPYSGQSEKVIIEEVNMFAFLVINVLHISINYFRR